MANVDKDIPRKAIPNRRFKVRDFVFSKRTRESYHIIGVEFDFDERSWMYFLEDSSGVENSQGVHEDELRIARSQDLNNEDQRIVRVKSWQRLRPAKAIEYSETAEQPESWKRSTPVTPPVTTEQSEEIKLAEQMQFLSMPNTTVTLWEDESTLCFQVEARGLIVARREDNNFINGTKLLLVAEMIRSQRDRILKSEKIRHEVKVGPMHLKGVWIPFDRALELANQEKIAGILYPLFGKDISGKNSTLTLRSQTLDSVVPVVDHTKVVSNPKITHALKTEIKDLQEPMDAEAWLEYLEFIRFTRLRHLDDDLVDRAFFSVIKNRRTNLVRYLVTHWPRLKNAECVGGRSALNYAVVHGDQNTVKVLLEAGASVNQLDKQGRSPLSLAAQQGHEIIVSMLLDGSAYVNLRDSNSCTALSWAMMSEQHLVAKLLRAKGAVIDAIIAFTDLDNTLDTFGTNLARQEPFRGDVSNVYSSCSVAEAKNMDYQVLLAWDMLKVLHPTEIDEEVLDHVSLILPDILKSFALKLSASASKENGYNAMVFVLNYRSQITNTLIDQWRNSRRRMDQLESDQMSSEERVRVWREVQAQFSPMKLEDDEVLTDKANYTEQEGDPNSLEHQDHELESFQETLVDLDFITTDPAYSWLLTKLINAARLSVPQPNTMDNVREDIRSLLPRLQKINRKTPRVLYTMKITMDWHLVHFLRAYDFDGGHDFEHILRNFVALTSDGEHVQALTVLQYLQQTWPQIGENILDLVIKIIQNDQASTNFEEYTLSGIISGSYLVFDVLGAADFIAEIGQILSWIGAIFRPSPKEGVIYECTPLVQYINPQNSGPFPSIAQKYSTKGCAIEYRLKEARTPLAHCWHGLFHYAVVALGFPIMRRPSSVQGLEMSLGMMLALCQSRHIGQYNDTIMVKSFSSMFSLSEHKAGISMWHFTRNLDDSFIPYSRTNDRVKCGGLGVQEILRDRHFVGWCSHFVYGLGSLDIIHQVKPSCLPRTQPGCHLFGASIRRGHALPREPFCIAHNQQSPHLTLTQDLHRRLERIHAKPVVFWDTASQRGWLTNGTSALLHLVLASVEKGDNPFTSTYNLRKTDIIQHETNTENAAAYVLLNEQNLGLQIRSHLGRPIYFQDRVEDILYLLDLMMDQQTMAIEKNNASFGMLEGWDFRDVVSAAPDILHSRFFPLDKDCSGWLQLLKDTYAVTIFGEDFGELYKPFNLDLCKEWTTLPPDRCYLAAGAADLGNIAQLYGGNSRSIPLKLSVNTIWPVIRGTSEKCACTKSLNHSDLSQILMPSSTSAMQPDNKSILRDIPSVGAVVFGPMTDHRLLHPNYFSTSVEPSRRKLRHDSDSDFVDSGLGDSISSAPTEASSPKHTDYHVAIICALSKELFAVRCLFDEIYSDPEFDKNDKNSYAFGRIFSCKIVAACLPGIYGTNSATQVMVELNRSFPLEFCLLVGIAGGIPSSKNDIRLGDIVVSRPSGNHSGLIKYDFEKVMQGGASCLLGSFNHPPQVLLSAIGILKSDPHDRNPLALYLDKIGSDYPAYRYPGADLDVLYSSDHIHTEASIERDAVQREPRESTQPRIHYGLIASGDKLVKDAKVRDDIGSKYNALCFEMEGAGIANVLPSLVIRGISDYSDSQKNDIWQEYASATAAAYAKLILGKIRSFRNT